MADPVPGRREVLLRESLRFGDWLREHRGLVAIGSLMAVAAFLRFWSLDSQALHHDESLHAQFTWYLFDGRPYIHNPLMHGPFLFHIGAGAFFLFGDSDFSARMVPAVFGVVLVGLPLLLRKQLGWTAVIIAAVLLTFSPTLLYFSRFLRNDIYIAVWTLGMVICCWRYLDERKPGYLIGLAALMALSFATKEITFIFVAIVLVFLNLMLASELGRRREDEQASELFVFFRTLVLFPLAWLIAAIWPLLGRRPFGRAALPPVGDLLVVVGVLALPQFAAGIQILPFIGDKGVAAPGEEDLRLVTVVSLVIASAFVGIIWRPRVWPLVAVAFYLPFVLLFTTFFTNLDGFLSGIWGSLDYWLGQQDVRRGNQPDYYYALVTPLYEFLPLLLTLVGGLWLVATGNALHRWLLFWLISMFVGLSVAGEKMPWLEVHIALPLALAGAVVLARLVDILDFKSSVWFSTVAAALLSSVAVLLLVDRPFQFAEIAGWILGASLAGWIIAAAMGGWRGFGRALATVSVAALFLLTVRAGVTVSFQNDDTPVEVLVYTQSSPEIPALRERIDEVARESGLGFNLPIVVDGTDGYAWPWAWYLRNYKSVAFVNDVASYEAAEGAVLLVHATNATKIDATGYSQTPYKHRWWFNETYRDLSVGDVTDILSSSGEIESLGDFFLYRRPVEGTTGSTNAVAFFPISFAAFDTGQKPKPPAEPRALADGRIVFGRTGLGSGEILQAADVFADAAGNIWVADALASRIHKFDSQGVFIASFGTTGSEPGRLTQPWSVVVDDEGFIYVADTWNHRIQKFSPKFEFVLAWGVPGSDPNADGTQLYGPRDLVIAPNGTIWITDTGNKRLVNFSREGLLLGSYGQAGGDLGDFSEPVGLAVDATGRLYVADAWNGRVQSFVPGAASPIAFETGWTSRQAMDKPYLTVLADGRILASDPANGLLVLFAADGTALGSWEPVIGGLPLGVAALPDGGFVFSDGLHNEVQIVPGDLLESLFRG